MTKYFTVKSLEISGLTDQLATQFARLYSLGCLCQYEYIYTPFNFPRSHGYTAQERLISKIEQFIFFTFTKIYDFRLIRVFINKIFSFLYKITTKFSRINKNEEILHFLGFYNFENKIDDNKFINIKTITVNLDEILENHDIKDIFDLKNIIDSLSLSYPLIYEFVWTEKMYSFINKIDEILNKSAVNSIEFTNCKLSEKYWRQIKQGFANLTNINDQKINVVVHIRLGDSTPIHLGEKILYVNGPYLYTNLDSMDAIFNIDPNRKPITLQQYEIVLNRIFEIFGRENIFCTILSDGYERTFNVITNYLIKDNLKLSALELLKLKYVQKTVNDDLKKFIQTYSDASIIGESFDNFLKSIHILASSEFVVWGTGGFAFYTHKLFKKYNQFSRLIHITNHTEEVFQEMNKLKQASNKT